MRPKWKKGDTLVFANIQIHGQEGEDGKRDTSLMIRRSLNQGHRIDSRRIFIPIAWDFDPIRQLASKASRITEASQYRFIKTCEGSGIYCER